ncbi:hypothetical protein F2Q70_00030228 [Brassica cretica]|uniref:Uncharacterized protein n=1 Tax=Brassica cretica TaxID=69181 RepID=A0A8S9FQH3_BRACR|nr:hypothetical protein F2Q70_00030228 [Brassica cretica]
MVKMIRVLHQVLREVIQWQGHEKVVVSKQRQEAGESCRLVDDLKEFYKQVCGTLVKLGKKNMVLVNEERRLEALIEVLQKDLQPVVKMYARTTSYGKTAVNTATATRTASSSATRKIPEAKVFQAIEGKTSD